jgi:hypothetical protein
MYEKAGKATRVVLAIYWVLLVILFFGCVVSLAVGNSVKPHNSQLEYISFLLLFGLMLISYIDHIAGSRNWKDRLIRPLIILGAFIEVLWPLSLVLVITESGLRKLFGHNRDFRLFLFVSGIFLNIVGFALQFVSTFK